MKLYTEKQVREAFHDGIVYATMHPTSIQELDKCVQDAVDSLTPIELPSDEEIEELMNKNGYYEEDYDNIWREGAKWMKEQILNQNK